MKLSLESQFTTALPCNCMLAEEEGVLLGMYQLDSETGERHGAIHRIDCRKPTEAESFTSADFPGVFDLVVAELAGSQALLASGTDGAVHVFQHGRSAAERRWAEAGAFESKGEMLTSCCAARDSVIATAHLGAIFQFDSQRNTLVRSWAGHEFDAWCVSSTHDPEVVMTGGDDGFLRLWDLRSAASIGGKRHNAGIVTLLPAPGCTEERRILAGSYDEHLYFYDLRSLREPVDSAHVGGGVWRCRPALHEKQQWLVVAAMQAGALFVQFCPEAAEGAIFQMQDASRFHTDGDPLIYDVQPVVQDGRVVYLWSCSFYECSVVRWKLT